MKKNFLLILIVFFIIIVIAFVNLRNLQRQKREAISFNKTYEQYNKEHLNGLDITTVINKAINNNEKYAVSKDEEGFYINDEKNSVQIYITMIINQKTYPMEKINALGMNSFIEYFGVVDFKCTDIQYHDKTGRVASMTFEATEY